MPKQAESQPKKSLYSILDREENRAMFKMLDDLVGQHHSHLADAQIALAWRYEIKPDKDGLVELGKCKKASELDRKLHDFDFVIILNFTWWNQVATGEQQRALLDHELCHAQIAADAEGNPKEDEDGHTIYRKRKHDVEEFREVIERHGIYKGDLEGLAATILRRYEEDRPLLKGLEDDEADRNGEKDGKKKKAAAAHA